MEEIRKLEYLSLVSKICTELDNHLGISDKDLAEFIIDLAEKNDTFESFKKALNDNGAEFTESFISTLLRIIKQMRPKDMPLMDDDEDSEKDDKTELEKLKVKFPGLAIPNSDKVIKMLDEDDDEDIAEAAIAELEALNPRIKKEKADSRSPDYYKEKSKHKKLKSSEKKSRRHSSERHHRRKRSRSRSPYCEKKKRYSRSPSPRKDSRKRHRSRSRSSSPYFKKERHHSPDKKHHSYDKRSEREKLPPLPLEPVVSEIYNGKVTNIMQFGCFVQLEGLRKRWEGLVHISQLRREGRVTSVGDVVQKGQRVKVKVLSFTGQKTSLSMKVKHYLFYVLSVR
ncbi:ATP-dependent RNA helicase DHX8 [Trichonephila inaurata madagascariensis]|uniref:ATP-dependent RNA helicase DHX8 n=1 Tax=Trichonephila inaurata madagascariensis TaxID=2747483 RepID=A0A8X7CIK5_9ARAC|nr:ATP-dependent RNA helicase DHX8 [Trichonephila inaurata madagascariensis]